MGILLVTSKPWGAGSGQRRFVKVCMPRGGYGIEGFGEGGR
jgi:hypothetical protein